MKYSYTTQIKVFVAEHSYGNCKDLEKEVNEFIKDKNVTNVQYISTEGRFDKIMVVYQEFKRYSSTN